MATSLSTADRRTHERHLLADYLSALAALGVPSVPTLDNAWLLYREAMAWGLVIGWLLCPEQNYGAEILAANVRRLVAACHDVGTFDALGV